ncbi:MAG: DUF2249 domain-containing protein [Candidatus Nanopelagicales bacterium]
MSQYRTELPLAQAGHGSAAHTCTCGEHDQAPPVLDARAIPHAIRHASIFGALDSLTPGAGMVLIAPHDPLPLISQAQDRYGDAVGVQYLQRGPEEWHLQFDRTQ